MTGGRHERIQREFSVTGFIFTYVQKYFWGILALLAGRGRSSPIDPPLMRPIVTYVAW